MGINFRRGASPAASKRNQLIASVARKLPLIAGYGRQWPRAHYENNSRFMELMYIILFGSIVHSFHNGQQFRLVPASRRPSLVRPQSVPAPHATSRSLRSPCVSVHRQRCHDGAPSRPDPSSTSRWIASRTGMRLMPNCSANHVPPTGRRDATAHCGWHPVADRRRHHKGCVVQRVLVLSVPCTHLYLALSGWNCALSGANLRFSTWEAITIKFYTNAPPGPREVRLYTGVIGYFPCCS